MDTVSAENYIVETVRKAKRKENVFRFLESILRFAGIGAALSMILEGLSLFIVIYWVDEIAVTVLFVLILMGAILGWRKRASMKETALLLDQKGLKERISTSLELIERKKKNNSKEYTSFETLQIRDTKRIIKEKEPLFIPEKFPWKLLLFVLLFLAGTLLLRIVPSEVKTRTKIEQQVIKEAAEERKEVEETIQTLENLKENASLTEEEKKTLSTYGQSFETSRKGYEEVKTEEALAKAKQSYAYKLSETAKALEELAKEVSEESGSNELSKTAEELEQKAAEKNGTGTGKKNTETGTGSGSSTAGEKTTETGTSESSTLESSATEGNSEKGGMEGESEETGNGSEEGFGKEKANLGESDQGNGSSGRGEGHIENSGSSSETEISVPSTDTLSGKESGLGEAGVIRGDNGLSWEGERVPYSEVIGSYSEKAYEEIDSGTYPSDMSELIRDYFSSLNNE